MWRHNMHLPHSTQYVKRLKDRQCGYDETIFGKCAMCKALKWSWAN